MIRLRLCVNFCVKPDSLAEYKTVQELVDSGDAETMGIGVITDAKVEDFYNKMVEAGVVDAGIDYKKTYTTEFVGNSVGMDLK